MFTLDELAQKAAACQRGGLSLDDFEDWFRTNSVGAYASDVPGIREAAASVEAAFSKFYFQSRAEQELLKELITASRPFGRRIVRYRIVSEPQKLNISLGSPGRIMPEGAFVLGTASSVESRDLYLGLEPALAES